MAVRVLRKIQIGTETTAGTAVAASTVWRSPDPAGMIDDARDIIVVPENIGYAQWGGANYQPKYGAALAMADQPATYQQLPYILAAGVENIVSGTQDGAGSGYIYQYDFPATSMQSIKTFTIEAGDDQRQDEMEYSFVQNFALSGNKGEAVMMSADWFGRQATDCSFTASQSVPTTIEEILFLKGKLYLDASGGSIGDTQAENCWLGFTLDVNTGWVPLFTAEGNLYFSSAKCIGPVVTGTLVLEHDATAETEIGYARAGTARLMRMLFTGSSFTTAGTTYSAYTLKCDFAIKYTDVPVIEDDEGDDVVTLPFQAYYSSTDTQPGQIIVVNTSSTLP